MLRKEDERRIDTLEIWIWRKMAWMSREDRWNKEVLRRVGEESVMLGTTVIETKDELPWTWEETSNDKYIQGTTGGKRERNEKVPVGR